MATLLIVLYMTVSVSLVAESIYGPAFLNIFFLFLHYSNLNYIAKKIVIPCSVGVMAPGKITSVDYHSIPISVYGWVVGHEFIGPDKKTHTSVTKNISKKDVGYIDFQKGDAIHVLFDCPSSKHLGQLSI